MKFLVNKNGESKWYKVDAISGDDAILTQYKEHTLYRSLNGNYQIFDNFDGTQLYAIRVLK